MYYSTPAFDANIYIFFILVEDMLAAQHSLISVCRLPGVSMAQGIPLVGMHRSWLTDLLWRGGRYS